MLLVIEKAVDMLDRQEESVRLVWKGDEVVFSTELRSVRVLGVDEYRQGSDLLRIL